MDFSINEPFKGFSQVHQRQRDYDKRNLPNQLDRLSEQASKEA